MKNLGFSILILTITAISVFSQNNRTESEVLRIFAEIDKAFIDREIKVLEKYFADDFVAYTPTGLKLSRSEALSFIRGLFEERNRTSLVNTGKPEDVKIKVSGNTAIVTAEWNDVLNDAKNSVIPTHKDSGRATYIFEKRGGKWLAVAHHITEADHAQAQTEAELIYAGRQFYKALENKNRQALNDLLTDDYVFTDENSRAGKEQNLGFYTSPDFKLISEKTEDQKFRILGTSAAIETGRINLVFDFAGERHDEWVNYTTVWVRRNNRWQIAADHLSAVKKSSNDNESLFQIIERHHKNLMRWYAQGNIEEVIKVFAEDAWQMPPNRQPLVGRKAIYDFWSNDAKLGKWEFTLEAKDVWQSGGMAVERGKYVLKFTPNEKAPSQMKAFEDRGNYLAMWRKESDDEWRIVWDAPVSEVPMFGNN